MLKSYCLLIFLPPVQNWKQIDAIFKLIMILQSGIKNEEKKQDFFSEVYGWERLQIPSNKEWENISNLPYAWPVNSIHNHMGEPKLYLVSHLLFAGQLHLTWHCPAVWLMPFDRSCYPSGSASESDTVILQIGDEFSVLQSWKQWSWWGRVIEKSNWGKPDFFLLYCLAVQCLISLWWLYKSFPIYIVSIHWAMQQIAYKADF